MTELVMFLIEFNTVIGLCPRMRLGMVDGKSSHSSFCCDMIY
jgi:hypothetical protein